MIKLRYNWETCIGGPVVNQPLYKLDSIPIYKWLVDNVGPVITRAEGEVIHGEGWYNEWDWVFTPEEQNLLGCIVVTKDITPEQQLDFVLRFT